MAYPRKSRAPKWSAAIEYVAPEIAAEYLAHNEFNRKKRRGVIGSYQKMMVDGEWYEGVGSIVFDWDGNLADGQHRLEGIITSGQGQWMLVVRGVDPKARAVMDRGARRDLADNANNAHLFDNLSTRHVATATRMKEGLDAAPREISTDWASLAYIRLHWERLDWSIAAFRKARPKNGIDSSPFRAVIARAYGLLPDDVIERFIEVLATGRGRPGEYAATELRDLVIAMRTARLDFNTRGLGRVTVRDIYAYCETALMWFSTNKDPGPRSPLRKTEFELFPLPEEAGGHRRAA